ncbi:MAG TPA: hypothetical protein VGC74_10160 [Stenotrophomonas sp.]
MSLPTLDAILQAHANALSEDLPRYRNHAYRVANFHWALSPGSSMDLEIVSVAVAFHDLGLWTANTFDYLAPSEALAIQYLEDQGRRDWIPMVVAMIDHHHQLSEFEGAHSRLVDNFRRADWIDVTMGLRRFGLPSSDLKGINRQFPYLGFHQRLVRIGLGYAWRHPFNPLPMFKR